MKLGIITCDKLPNGVEDDQSFLRALTNKGIAIDIIAWDSGIDCAQYDACLLRSVWDYHENLEAFNHWLGETSLTTKIINSQEVVIWNQNKHYLAELEAFGITIAPTTWINKTQKIDLARWCESQSASVFFLKPVVGADSSGTFRFKNNEIDIALATEHLEKWLPEVDMMLQPYIKTVETFGETSAIYFAGTLSHAVRKVPVKGDYRVQDTYGATDLAYNLNPAEMALAKASLDYLTEKFGDIIYARFDFLHDQHGTVLLNEAELIEPSLFFNHASKAANKLAQVIYDALSSPD